MQRSNSKKNRGSYVDRYLSRWHRDNPGDGCTMAALAQEVARSTPELKAAFEQGLQEILPGIGEEREEAIFCAAVG
jgi:TetR/AcrR family transcriptional regulator, transcriptional repressor for nem operon